MNAHRGRGRNGQAFTLIELLVASVAFAILFSAVYVVFHSGKQIRDQATELTRSTRLRARAASIIREDLRGGWISGGSLASNFTGGAEAQASPFPGRLRLTTTSESSFDRRDAGAGSGIQEVEYFIAEDPWSTNQSGGGLLIRSVRRNLLAPVFNPVAGQALLSGVRELRVGFFDGDQWVESWDSALVEGEAPEAVSVRIDFELVNGQVPRERPLELVVPWGAEPLTTNSTESASSESQGGEAP